MSTAWSARECPICGWGPYNREEDTCANPFCEKHWSHQIPSVKAAEGERRAAIANLNRRTPR